MEGDMKKKVSIIGASGYSGAELLKILLHHPGVEVTKVFANSSAGKKVAELYPSMLGRTSLAYEEFTPFKTVNDDLVFIALPSGEAMQYVPTLIDGGKKVIDLGGDFRLQDPTLYQKYYKHEHTATQYLSKAVYGLPEWNREKIESATLVANPGCYVTSVLLAVLPLVKEGIIDPHGISISAMSGVSGAGRSASVELSFSEVNESVKAYKVAVHQHIPEIEDYLKAFGGNPATVTFIPHLIPISRGIYSTIFTIPLEKASIEAIADAFEKYYKRMPFVRLLWNNVPEIKNVAHTNYCDIGWKFYKRNDHLVIMSVLDNLVKGAAGQAVQNMNIMFGFDETTGLI